MKHTRKAATEENVTTGPVVSALAQQWLDGTITSEDYFAQVRRQANAEAVRTVAACLAQLRGR